MIEQVLDSQSIKKICTMTVQVVHKLIEMVMKQQDTDNIIAAKTQLKNRGTCGELQTCPSLSSSIKKSNKVNTQKDKTTIEGQE